MTVTDQIKILDRKIMQNEAQYDLDRKAAKISALSSNNLDKYEYLTCEDLDLKPSTVEQARFEYSPLGKIFDKGLKKEGNRERHLKRLKNNEDENEERLKAIKNNTENIKEVTYFVEEPLSLEAKELHEEIKVIQKDVDYRKLKITGGNNITFDFSDYKTFKELFRELYYKIMSINEVERKQEKFDGLLGALSTHSAEKKEYIKAKNKLLNNANKIYKGRGKIIEAFKNGMFPLNYDEEEEFRHKEKENKIRNENGLIDYEKLERLIHLKNRDINNELVRKHFQVHNLRDLLKNVKKSNNNTERNYIQVVMINSGLRDLKEETEDMSEQEKETENPNEIVDIVERICEVNRQQQGKGLKILTLNQMLSRLPILLVQLKAGNNSEKLKHKTRQLLYYFYRSKKLTKNLYKSLIHII